jgi:hypothetical protein
VKVAPHLIAERAMRTRLLVLAICAALFGVPANAAEPSTSAPLTPVQLHLLHYAYVQFPRELATASDEVALAEYEHALLVERAASYRPFRSFGPYAATYFADQQAQFHAVISARELQCAQRHKTDLWRQRQEIVQAYLLESAGRPNAE